MATSLPAVGTFSYNGVTFGVMTASSVEGRPVYDSAGRTIIHVVYTITANTTLNVGGVTSTDATLESVRRSLLTPGGILVYDGKGFGNNFTINSGTRKDVVWGPKPKILGWKTKGGNLSAEVSYQIEIAIPECTSAAYELRPMEHCFKVQYAIDNEGYTTRTYSGHVSIPQTRRTVGTRTLSDSADRLREQVTPPLPLGFRRNQNFSLSEDKCRLDYTIVDEELPAPLPPRVLHCDANHVVRNVNPKNLHLWGGTITATYELERTLARGKAMEYFLALVEDRLKKPRLYGKMEETSQKRGTVLITNLQISEPDIFGRNKASFSCSYIFLTDRAFLLRASGLFTPVPGTDYRTWRTSLENTAHHVRGNAKMLFRTRGDAIIDLCAIAAQDPRDPGQELRPPAARPPKPPLNKCPPPNESWLYYDVRVEVHIDYGEVEMKPLPFALEELGYPDSILSKEEQVELDRKIPGPDEAARITNSPNGYSLMSSKSGSGKILSEVQARTAPSIYIILSGEAVRACHPIAMPTLEEVAGAEVVPYSGEGDFYETGQIGNFDGVTLIGMAFQQTYLMTEKPARRMGVPPSPMY